jgi:CRP/FNR family cyclic AMP-dependent transcriptional regulator
VIIDARLLEICPPRAVHAIMGGELPARGAVRHSTDSVQSKDLVAALSRSHLFADLTSVELGSTGASLRRVEYTRGAHIWLEGDSADRLYVLISGQVRLYRIGADGEEVTVEVYTEGDHFGEFGLFADGARVTQAQAMMATVCIELGKEPLLELLERSPEAMRRMLRSLSMASRSLLEDFTDLAFRDIAARVARKLLDLAELHGESTPEGIRISAKMSQADLASTIAASRPNVNRALAVLIAEGALEHHGGHFTIRDPERLRRASGSVKRRSAN